ncbi:hypothetical protein GCM10009674_10710 [Nesterenkonia xinjiangensis]
MPADPGQTGEQACLHSGSEDYPGGMQSHREESIGWIITVDEKSATHLDDVVVELQAAGLRVNRVLTSLGMINGRAREDQWETLAAVDGVVSVDREQEHRISPPDADVQ